MHARAQSADFIVIRKKNNRTLKTYFAGSFLSAVTYGGFIVNGYIKTIRNDSIYVVQQDTRLAPTMTGTKIDTVLFTLGFDYREVAHFNFSSRYSPGFIPGERRGGFFARILPSLMMIGGTGYIILELVNGAYRNESVSANGKLSSLLTGAGVAAAGFTWSQLQKKKARGTPKYKVIYVKKKVK